MKYIILIISVLCLYSCNLEVEPNPIKISAKVQQGKYKIENITSYTNLFDKQKQPKLYPLNDTVFIKMAKNTNKKYIAIFTYSSWKELHHDSIVKVTINQYQNNDSVQLVLLCSDDWQDKEEVIKFLKKIGYNYNSFILDIRKYGVGYNPNGKLKKFFESINYSTTDRKKLFDELFLIENKK